MRLHFGERRCLINKVLRGEVYIKADSKKEPYPTETLAKKVPFILSRAGQQLTALNLLHKPALSLEPIAPENSKSILVVMPTDLSARKADDAVKDHNIRLHVGDSGQ
jgi:hypothetical protein